MRRSSSVVLNVKKGHGLQSSGTRWELSKLAADKIDLVGEGRKDTRQRPSRKAGLCRAGCWVAGARKSHGRSYCRDGSWLLEC